MDASVAENTKRDNLINDLKEEIKVNFLANQELKKQAESAAELEKTVKTELTQKEKELKTELDKNKVSRAPLWRHGHLCFKSEQTFADHEKPLLFRCEYHSTIFEDIFPPTLDQ